MTTGRINQVAALIHERCARKEKATKQNPSASATTAALERATWCWIVRFKRYGKRIALRADSSSEHAKGESNPRHMLLPRGLSESFPSSEPALRKRSQDTEARIGRVGSVSIKPPEPPSTRFHTAFRRQSYSASLRITRVPGDSSAPAVLARLLLFISLRIAYWYKPTQRLLRH